VQIDICGNARLTMGNTWTKNTRPESSDDLMLVDVPDSPIIDGVDDSLQLSETEKTISGSKTDLLYDGSRWNRNGHREKQCTTC